MIFYKKKRGVSGVVVVILLILITIVAAGVMSSVLVPFVKESLYKSTECLDYKNYFKFMEEIEFDGKKYNLNCRQNESYGFSIFTNGAEKPEASQIKSFVVVFNGNEGNKRIDISEGLDIGEVRMIDKDKLKIKVPELGGVQTYVFKSDKNFSYMELYPLLENGKLCDKTDRIDIKRCLGGTNLE